MYKAFSSITFCFKTSEKLIILLCFLIILGCKKKDNEPKPEWSGSGVDNFDASSAGIAQPMRVFYFVPANADPNTSIVFVFHGDNRNAMDYRNAIESKARSLNFIAVVPEFSDQNFPGVNAYQLGNMFQDGENPSPETLNPENKWSFSLVPAIVDFTRKKVGAVNAANFFIGHSGGAQFLHRFLIFKPYNSFIRAVVSAAGWYTIPDTTVTFPYGLASSPYQASVRKEILGKEVVIQVGSQDNNPNASSLRRNAQADLQGIHRLARAQYFYNSAMAISNELNTLFKWELRIIPGLDHSYGPAIQESSELLFKSK